ncbi:MAG: aspartate carbamoyltransferase [Candidatus Thermoplasmatota archaeon]|jgi:aspartate carbamoyltransferase catalytic subunit|nr:aspartate carbamoyltransferase [Candidatus Thermoplasmatota archaeon]MCL5988019.1 aspartate carbamoyltransferase [Candidatus Thermoplasmatota archaeon]
MLTKKSVVSIGDISNDDIFRVFERASSFKQKLSKGEKIKTMDGKIMATLFFEPSTRTRLSFESAMHRLGGGVISVSEPKSSSASKGETLADTIRMASSYSDIIAMRHPMEGAARLASEFSSVPVLNGGDGSGQHPTQTLLDLFTIWEKFKSLDDLNISMVGDLKYGRTVHSLLRALNRFDTTITLISPESLEMPDHILSTLDHPEKVTKGTDINPILEKTDVFYVTRIQKERFVDLNDYAKVIGSYSFDPETVSKMKKNAIIMHPLPRVDEISPDVDRDPRAFYFKQAENGVYVRMALIDMILGGA